MTTHPTFARCRLVPGTHPHGSVHLGTRVRARREGGTTARVSMANPVETTGDPRGAPTFEKFGLPDSLSSHGTLAKLSPNLEFSTSNDDEYLDT